MTTPASQLTRPTLRPSATRSLPIRQAGWIGAGAATAGLAGAAGLWQSQPELTLAGALSVGIFAVNPRRIWALPIVGSASIGASLLAATQGIPGVLGAALVCGIALGWLSPLRTDLLDVVNATLGTLLGASMGLFSATQLLPQSLPGPLYAALTAALIALLASQALWPLALRFDAPALPTDRELEKALTLPYRAPAMRALSLARAALQITPDKDAKRGLGEVATWVFRLQQTRQTLDQELAVIDPEQLGARITALQADDSDDAFTRDRRKATAEHLQRLIHHRQALSVEVTRSEAMVEYALAFLEEARAGITLARELPGESLPERLPEVLERLRGQAQQGDARRRTARELQPLA